MPVNATPGNGLVYLSWSGYYNWDFKFYRMITWQVPNTRVSEWQFWSMFETTTTIYGLTNGVSYYFTIEVGDYYWRVLESNQSNTVTPTSPVTVPSAPTIVTATAGNATANLNWTAPNNGGSQITHYIVKTYNSSNDNFVQDTSSTTIYVSVPSLNIGTSYYFKVLAVNAVGPSSLSAQSNSVIPFGAPSAPTIGTAISSSGSAIVNWSIAISNGSTITGYIVTDNFGVTIDASGVNTITKTINGLTNGKTYTFRVKAVSSNAGYSVDSNLSNIVLPISPTPITTGSNFIGKTLIIGSTSNFDTNYARVVEFNNNSQNTYLGVMFSATDKKPWFTFRPLNQMWTEPIMNWTADLSASYIYVFSFVSDIQVKYNIYEYNGTSTIIKGTGAIGAYTAASPFLQNLTQFWLGRTVWNDDMYSGTYAKIALYNGDLFALYQATILSTLTTLVQSTESNVYYNDLSNYAFRPVINNFIGVVVNRLNYNITTGSTTTTSNITLIRTGNSSGGYLNITGSFVELPTTPIIQSVTVSPGNGQVAVNWTPPENNGGNISSYTVTSTPHDRTSTVNGTTITAIVSELTIGTSYTFRVVATNDAGTSPQSDVSDPIIAVGVPDAPTIITVIPSDGNVTVTWSAGSTTNGSNRIGYIIEKKSEDETNWTSDTAGSGDIYKTIYGLTNGTRYYFRVITQSNVGNSETSSILNAIPFTVPSVPTNLIATASNGLVDLSWDAPFNGGRDISSYIIQRNIDSTNWVIDSSTNASTLFKQVTDLSNGTTYYFRVFASNLAGESSSSNVVMAIPYTVPSAPTITATAGNSLVNLSWNEPSNNGRDISSYTITRSYDNINWDIILVVPISDTLPLLTFTSANDFAMYFNIRFSTPTAILKVDSEYYLSQGNGPTYREYMHPLQLYYNNTTTGQAIITNGQGNMLIDGEVLRPRNVTIELIDSRGRNFILTRFCNPYPY